MLLSSHISMNILYSCHVIYIFLIIHSLLWYDHRQPQQLLTNTHPQCCCSAAEGHSIPLWRWVEHCTPAGEEDYGKLWWVLVRCGELWWECVKFWWPIVTYSELWGVIVSCGEVWWVMVSCGESVLNSDDL